MRALYKYPQRAFPYERLLEENARRGPDQPEYELLDTGVFDEDRYFDVTVEYAKGAPTDLLVRITVANRGPEAAELDLLPTLWFRDTWSWGTRGYQPSLSVLATKDGSTQILADHESLGRYHLTCDGRPELLFTNNDTNTERLFGVANAQPYVKDAFHDYVVGGHANAVNPAREGTKSAARYHLTVPAGGEQVVRVRLSSVVYGATAFGPAFDYLIAQRRREADAFYLPLAPPEISDDERLVQRQAFAGLLWSKQFYHYDVQRWLEGDPGLPPPPAERWSGRNHSWTHLNNEDVISMPDTWEYPWYAGWDLAFHAIPLAMIDPQFAKEQLVLLLREWFMHPNGQLPAYEWAFGDVNPPVHAWAAMRVYQIERRATGKGDVEVPRARVSQIAHQLHLVGESQGRGRSQRFSGRLPRPRQHRRVQSERAVAGWRAARPERRHELDGDVLPQHAGHRARARAPGRPRTRMSRPNSSSTSSTSRTRSTIGRTPRRPRPDIEDLWDNDDQFYYDLLRMPDGRNLYIRARSMVGLIPLLAVETMDAELLDKLPDFRARLEWFLQHRTDLVGDAASVTRAGESDRRLFAVVSAARLRSMLTRMLDESEFLSPHGLRSVSRWHAEHPFRLRVDGADLGEVDYEPAESTSGLFGGNSNWRGPVWMPLNYLIIEALQKFDWYYGSTFTVEYPTGSGRMLTLWEVSVELSRRLIGLFVRHDGRRPVFGNTDRLQKDPYWRDLILFHEYFHGDDGAGLGASHQTGWTALVAKLIQQSGVPTVK